MEIIHNLLSVTHATLYPTDKFNEMKSLVIWIYYFSDASPSPSSWLPPRLRSVRAPSCPNSLGIDPDRQNGNTVQNCKRLIVPINIIQGRILKTQIRT